MTMDDLREKVALAIHLADRDCGVQWDRLSLSSQGTYRVMASAALAAIEASGHRIVPVEPTEEMAEDGGRALVHPSSYMGGAPALAKRDAIRIYRAMLTAYGQKEE